MASASCQAMTRFIAWLAASSYMPSSLRKSSKDDPNKVQVARLKLIAVQGSNPKLWLLLLISLIPQGTEFTKSP
jgi:hypothetical protein